MSGIFGIVHLGGRRVDPEDLERMRQALAHRGPDGSDIWCEGGTGMGQLMLHSTPESLTETLPWRDPVNGLVITADARIDNREELIRSLRVECSSGRIVPDSQLILAAYERWGENCVDHLLGDFAFAIWNPTEKVLFCARDPMGVRPLYYLVADQRLLFASSALCVVAVSNVTRRINRQRIADYLVLMLEGGDKQCTWFEGVSRLQPAHYATWSGQGFRTRRYWCPDPEYRLSLSSDQEYQEAFAEVFSRAVRRRLRSHKPAASMLSGGVDSSTIAGVAHKIQLQDSGSPLATYSGVSPAREECRESLNIRKVIEQGGFESRLLEPSGLADFDEELNRIESTAEDPFDMNWIHHQWLYLNAAQDGHVAVMDGVDGNLVASLTSAYPVFLLRRGRFISGWRETLGLRRNFYGGAYPLVYDVTAVLKPLLIPNSLRRLKRQFSQSSFKALLERGLITREYALEVGLRERWERFEDDRSVMRHQTLRQSHVAQVDASYLTAAIERYGRLAAMCGCEQREPLLDREFIEFCISLPWRQKVRNGWSKYGLRRLAESVVPESVAWRPENRQGTILGKFWREWNRLHPERRDGLGNWDSEILRPAVDRKRLMDDLGHYDMIDVSSKERVVNFINLNRWLERNP